MPVDRMTDICSSFDVLRQNVPGNSVTHNSMERDGVNGDVLTVVAVVEIRLVRIG